MPTFDISTPSDLPPDTPDERRKQLAEILALGVLRLLRRQADARTQFPDSAAEGLDSRPELSLTVPRG